jgi:hypothetical protein
MTPFTSMWSIGEEFKGLSAQVFKFCLQKNKIKTKQKKKNKITFFFKETGTLDFLLDSASLLFSK